MGFGSRRDWSACVCVWGEGGFLMSPAGGGRWGYERLGLPLLGAGI